VTWRGFGRQVEVGSIGGDGEGSCAAARLRLGALVATAKAAARRIGGVR
jgi:hypothetical protein